MSVDPSSPPLNSDALKANLRETAAPVVINPGYTPLLDIVHRFQGLSAKLEGLLYEISHPYRNWKLIIPELRAFVLKNLNHYRDHEKGPESFTLFSSMFFDALQDSSRNELQLPRVMEAMLAYADKLIQSLDAAGLFRFDIKT